MRAVPELEVRHADVAGYPLAYAVQGSGAAVVLIHGSLCDLRYWKAQVAALGAAFRVFSVSLRHHWPERWDGHGGDFSIARHTADIAGFIEQVVGEPAHVVGHSRGAHVAFDLARGWPDLARSVTLADPGLPPAGLDDGRDDFRQRALQAIEAGDVERGLALFIDTVSGADTWRRMVPWFKEMVLDNANTLFGQAREPRLPVTAEQVHTLTKPVLLIGGALSPAPYPAILDYLQQWLPHAMRVTIAGSSHGMNLGNPRAFNTALRQFFQH